MAPTGVVVCPAAFCIFMEKVSTPDELMLQQQQCLDSVQQELHLSVFVFLCKVNSNSKHECGPVPPASRALTTPFRVSLNSEFPHRACHTSIAKQAEGRPCRNNLRRVLRMGGTRSFFTYIVCVENSVSCFARRCIGEITQIARHLLRLF